MFHDQSSFLSVCVYGGGGGGGGGGGSFFPLRIYYFHFTIDHRPGSELTNNIIMIIVHLICIAQFETNGILTVLYIVIKYIQMQYMRIYRHT